jgi:protein-tyrosine phosphatase
MFYILFVCKANLCRSPLAAAFFLRRTEEEGLSDEWIVQSAGPQTVAGQPIPPNVLKLASIMGINLRNHRTQAVDDDLLSQQDLVVVMEKGQREALRLEFPAHQRKVYLLSELAEYREYDIDDPARRGAGVNVHETGLALSRLVDRAYPTICQLAQAHETAKM